MDGRRVIHFGGPSFCLQASVGFGPRRERRAFLSPVDEGGFVAPVEKLAHGAAMGSGEHESFHLYVGSPDGCGPESAMAIAQYPGGEIAIGAGGLSRGLEGIEKEPQQKAPGTYAKSRDGDERHGYQFGRPMDGEIPEFALVLPIVFAEMARER